MSDPPVADPPVADPPVAYLHRTLLRQLRRIGADAERPPDAVAWQQLLRAVSTCYVEADDERYSLERSVEVSSQEMRELHDSLTRQAMEDALTGLANRAALMRHLTRQLSAGRDAARDRAVLFIDLDGFKAVNDTGGHAAGDELLVQVGRRIVACCREDDLVARIGGDEFVVACSASTGLEDAQRLAERIVGRVAAPLLTSSGPAPVTASVGVAVRPAGLLLGGPGGAAAVAEDLLRCADAAMYRAKATGKNRVAVGAVG